MHSISNSALAMVTGGATAKHANQPTKRPLPPQPSTPARNPPARNPVTDCALGAVGAGMWGANPFAGCIAGAVGGGGNSVLDALMSM